MTGAQDGAAHPGPVTTPQNAAFTADSDDPVPQIEEDVPRTEANPGSAPPREPSPEDELDPGEPTEPVGNDNIREGRVGGVMGGPREQGGQGQGG